jgi:hypothetical protein
MSYTNPVKFTVTGSYGCSPKGEDDVYTIEEFLELVECGAFIDYDGFGHPVRDSLSDEDIWVKPSTVKTSIPEDATHIVWFNR